MKNTATVIQMLIRLVGVVVLALGVILWIGQDSNLVIFHILFGVALVLLIWSQAYLAATKGVSGGLVALAVLWGLILPILGLTQAQILPGPAHWVIDVVHLVVGLGAIGQAEFLGRQIKQRETGSRSGGRSRSTSRAR